MVEMSLSGSGEGSGRETTPGPLCMCVLERPRSRFDARVGEWLRVRIVK